MKTLSERLKYAMEVLPPKKIKGVELARAAGVKPPSVSDWLSGKSKSMEGENLLRVSRFLGVDANWLATGLGNPKDKNTTLKDIFPELNNQQDDWYPVPMLKLNQAIDFKNDSFNRDNYPKGYSDYICHTRNSVFYLEDIGDEMIPRLQPTDRLLVDCSLNPYPGCYLVAQIGTRAFVRQYRESRQEDTSDFELRALNERYPTLGSKNLNIEIIGIVVGFSRDFYQMAWYDF